MYWSLVPAFPPCVVCVFCRVVGRCSPVLSYYVLYIYVPALFLLLLFSSFFYIVMFLFWNLLTEFPQHAGLLEIPADPSAGLLEIPAG